MKRSEMEKEMQALLRRPGAYLVLPADMTLEEAAGMGPSQLLGVLVEDRKPKMDWEPEDRVEGAPDVISKSRGGKTVHYLIGPTRESRGEAEMDLRIWLDKPGPPFDPVTIPREVVVAYENLRKFFFGSGV